MVFALYKSANVRLQIQMDTKRLRPFPENRVIRQAQKVSRLQVAQVAVVIAARSWCFWTGRLMSTCQVSNEQWHEWQAFRGWRNGG